MIKNTISKKLSHLLISSCVISSFGCAGGLMGSAGFDMNPFEKPKVCDYPINNETYKQIMRESGYGFISEGDLYNARKCFSAICDKKGLESTAEAALEDGDVDMSTAIYKQIESMEQ